MLTPGAGRVARTTGGTVPSAAVHGAVSASLRIRGLARVLADLARLGYDAQWATVRASDIGAPHDRARLFFLAVRPGFPSRLLAIAAPQARDHHGAQLPEMRREGGHQVNLNDAALSLAVSWERDRWAGTSRRFAGGRR